MGPDAKKWIPCARGGMPPRKKHQYVDDPSAVCKEDDVMPNN